MVRRDQDPHHLAQCHSLGTLELTRSFILDHTNAPCSKEDDVGIINRLMLAVSRASIDDIAVTLTPSELRKRVKIVVIDDEESSFPTKGLQDEGYTVEWWPIVDPSKLRRLESGDFDIIVLDIQGIVPPTISDTGDGLGILRRLKNVNPDQIIVAFSGKSYDLDSMQFFKRAEDVLRKPVSLIQCKEMIDRLIASHVSVRAYWDNLQKLLERQHVSVGRINRLEKEVSRSVLKGKGVSLDRVKEIVGTIDALQTVFGWVQRIAALCIAII